MKHGAPYGSLPDPSGRHGFFGRALRAMRRWWVIRIAGVWLPGRSRRRRRAAIRREGMDYVYRSRSVEEAPSFTRAVMAPGPRRDERGAREGEDTEGDAIDDTFVDSGIEPR